MAKKKASAESTVRTIRRQTRKKHSAEDKIRIVIEGLRGESTIAELCRKEGISQSVYYSWSKEFLEAGKSRLTGDTKRNADASEVKDMRYEVDQLKLLVAELSLDNRRLKKSLRGLGEES
jgi:transposase